MQPRHRLTVDAYLAATPELDVRHEWVNGEAYAMAGGTPLHAAVAMNVGVALTLACRGRPCRPTSSDQRVYVAETEAFFYPDVSVVCGPFRYAAIDPHSLINPAVLFEVLSPTTADFDRGAKFEHYRHLPDLKHYVLVDPEERHVIHHARTPEGWLRRDLHGGDLVLGGLDLVVPIDALYADLDAVRVAAVDAG
jgi:Uma2 family endonuclease